MDDNKLLNEAYNKKVVKEDAGDQPGNYRPAQQAAIEDGFKTFLKDFDVDDSPISFELLEDAFRSGFYEGARHHNDGNIPDDWEIRY